MRYGLAIFAAWLAACGAPPAVEMPPEIMVGLDECSHCRMIVSEERYAAVALGPDGQEGRFDDLGCLMAFLEHSLEPEAWSVWVHTEREWEPASRAWYSRTEIVTPMGSGLVAYGHRASARAATGNDTAFTWADLLPAPGIMTRDRFE